MTNIRANSFAVFFGVTQIYAWASTYYLPATLLQPVSAQLGLSHLILIGGFSFAQLVGGLLAPAIGGWIEKSGGRNPLVLGSLLVALGLLTLSGADGIVLWYVGWTIVGLGMALTLFNTVFSTLGQLYGHRAKGLILKVTLLSGFATFLWPLTTFLIEHFGWRKMLVIYACPHLLVMAPLYLALIPAQSSKWESKKDSAPQSKRESAQTIFYILGCFAILRTLVGAAVSVHVINVFENIGLTAEKAAFVAALIGPAQIAGRLFELLFGRRVDPLNSAIFWSAVLPVSLLALMFMGAQAAIPFAVGYGMSNGMATISLSVLLMTYFDLQKYPTLMGKISLPTLIMQAVSPLLAASLFDSLPMVRVFLIATLISVIAVACLVPIRRLGSHVAVFASNST